MTMMVLQKRGMARVSETLVKLTVATALLFVSKLSFVYWSHCCEQIDFMGVDGCSLWQRDNLPRSVRLLS
jgi:hypothetical protein